MAEYKKYTDDDLINALKNLGGTKENPNTALEVFEYLSKEIKYNNEKQKNSACRKVRRHMRELIGKSDDEINKYIENDYGMRAYEFYSIGFVKKQKKITGYWYMGKQCNDNVLARYLSDVITYSKVINPEFKIEYYERLCDIFGKGNVGEPGEFEKEIISLRPYAPKALLDGGGVDILKNVLEIESAIKLNKKISFKLCVYRVVTNNDGRKIQLDVPERTRTVSPYQIMMSNGRYYLIATDDENEKVKYYRIDLMFGIEKLDEKRKSVAEKKWENPSKYMVSNPYLYSGETEDIIIGFQEQQITQIVDWFGTEENNLYELSDEYSIIGVNNDQIIMQKIKFFGVNVWAFSFWIMQYLDCAEVLEGDKLIKIIQERIKWANSWLLEIEE